jgi:hypothetical protein
MKPNYTAGNMTAVRRRPLRMDSNYLQHVQAEIFTYILNVTVKLLCD